jgi:hypothetical protein
MNNTIVLLTDGRNEAVGGLSLAELVKRLKAADPKKQIQIVTIAFGADADHRALAQISAATGGGRTARTVPPTSRRSTSAVSRGTREQPCADPGA